MVRLVASLIILAIVLIVRLIVWLARPKPATVTIPTYGAGMGPGGGFGPGAGPGYGPPGGYGPQAGFGPPGGGYGPPPGAGGYAPGQGPPVGGYGAPPGAGYGAAPGAGYGAPPGGYGAPQMGAGGVRMLVRQDCPFDRLSACLAQAGLQPASPPGPAVQPGEPASAAWQSPTVQVRYSFDPSTYSRILDITGPQAEQLRQHLQAQIG